MNTSKFWWLGFGMRLRHEHEEFYIAKGFKKVYVNNSDLKNVRVERRALRGWTLVIETTNKPIYFRMNKRGARKAMLWIRAKYTHQVGASL